MKKPALISGLGKEKELIFLHRMKDVIFLSWIENS